MSTPISDADVNPIDPSLPLDPLPGHSSRGRLERVLRRGEFAVTAELNPPDSANPKDVYERAAIFDGWVDGINAVDASGANCHMSSVGICALLTRMGYAPIMQIACRDKNRIAIQGDVLGASAMGVQNILCLTGDGVQARRPAGRQAGVRSRFHVAAGNHPDHARRGQVPVGPQADDAAAGFPRSGDQPVRAAIRLPRHPFRQEDPRRRAIRAKPVLLRRADVPRIHEARARHGPA